MPRTCTVCNHAERAAIDKSLVDGVPFRTIAQQFGTSATALHRHKAEHLPAKLVKAQAAAEVAQADDLLAQMKRLQTVTMNVLKLAYDAQDLRTALVAVGQARQNTELVAKLLGELEAARIQVAVVTTSPDWLRLRAAILNTLDPYPDARGAVLEALHDVS